MHKAMLTLDDLTVESFETSAISPGCSNGSQDGSANCPSETGNCCGTGDC